MTLFAVAKVTDGVVEPVHVRRAGATSTLCELDTRTWPREQTWHVDAPTGLALVEGRQAGGRPDCHECRRRLAAELGL